ncbi:MAG: aminoacyl-tRNA hydrolase [Parcubacteria group bacterium]|nr:aminoacyl-tRNA hydrolase [Parcubacteria group bacterium]
MKLIVGLGNPGKKYEKTRHNVGFLVLDAMTSGFKFEKKFNAEVVETGAGKNKIIFAKPQTFMNNSGETVLALKKYYKIKLEDIIVVHDELDLEFGKIRASIGSRSAGHNGAQSIIDFLDTKNFTRVRVGIGPCPEKIPAEKFVLQKFGKKEEKGLEDIIENTVEIIEK